MSEGEKQNMLSAKVADAGMIGVRERHLLDAVAVPCFCTDTEGRYMYGNRAFLRVSG